MTHSRRPAFIIVSVIVLAALWALPALAQPPRTQVEGGSPSDDAIGWSQLSFADDAAPTVLIATDADFADALTAGAIQGLLEAPLLLTAPETLTPSAAAEIQRLGASRGIILGGTDAVSSGVETELQALGLDTERVEGETRLETAVAVQQRFFPNATAVVLARAFGTDTDPTQAFADSIPAGAYSSVANTPVLLTETDVLSTPTANALAPSAVDTVTIVGGVSAVSDAVATQAAAIETRGSTGQTPGITVRRLAGNSRFETAIAINRDLGYNTAADSPRVFLVEGQAEDAWTGGLPAAAQAGNSASVVLANGDLLLSPTFDFLFNADVPLICGPNVTQSACDKALEALQGMGQADDAAAPGSPSDMPSEEDSEGPLDLLPTDLPVTAQQ